MTAPTPPPATRAEVGERIASVIEALSTMRQSSTPNLKVMLSPTQMREEAARIARTTGGDR